MGSLTPDRGGATIVLLAGADDTTNIVYNYLRAHLGELTVIQEDPVSRVTLARRRARRLGWPVVIGQVAFVVGVLPLLRRRARRRVREILADAHLDARPIPEIHHVASVNDVATARLLRDLDPAVVVVNGTRVIAASILEAVPCPFLNMHAGITPRYRGVHGGYWALAEGRPELVGTTVHVIDRGIDTGPVLAQATFAPGPHDTIASYPYLHVAAGLPVLAEIVERILSDGTVPPASPTVADGESQLRWHPTLWGYLWRRSAHGVR